MSISYSFMDNATYSADDVNRLFSKLTLQGVSLFNYSNNNNPLVSINNAVASFVEPGLEAYNKNSCKVIYNSQNEKFYISTGNAFMKDGSTISIDGTNYDITEQVTGARENLTDRVYVCFFRNQPNNTIDIVCSTSNTTYNNQMSVKLAEIVGTTILDTRVFAKTKLVPSCTNHYEEISVSPFAITYANGRHCYREFDINFVNARYASFQNMNFEITNIASTDGTDLSYQYFYDSTASYYIAFNYTNNKLQLWGYIPRNTSNNTTGTQIILM